MPLKSVTQAPAELRRSRAEVRVVPGPGRRAAPEGPGVGMTDSTAVLVSDKAARVLRMGATEQEVLAMASPLQSVAVVTLRCAGAREGRPSEPCRQGCHLLP